MPRLLEESSSSPDLFALQSRSDCYRLQEGRGHVVHQDNPKTGKDAGGVPRVNLNKFRIEIPDAIQEARNDPASLSESYTLGTYDVGCGRGQRYCNHPGNVRFRDIVNQHVDTYIQTPTKVAKTALIISILNQVRCINSKNDGDQDEQQQQQGRFVKQQEDGSWVELGDAASRDKVSNALRSAVALKKGGGGGDECGENDGASVLPSLSPKASGDEGNSECVVGMVSSDHCRTGDYSQPSCTDGQGMSSISAPGKDNLNLQVQGENRAPAHEMQPVPYHRHPGSFIAPLLDKRQEAPKAKLATTDPIPIRKKSSKEKGDKSARNVPVPKKPASKNVVVSKKRKADHMTTMVGASPKRIACPDQDALYLTPVLTTATTTTSDLGISTITAAQLMPVVTPRGEDHVKKKLVPSSSCPLPRMATTPPPLHQLLPQLSTNVQGMMEALDVVSSLFMLKAGYSLPTESSNQPPPPSVF